MNALALSPTWVFHTFRSGNAHLHDFDTIAGFVAQISNLLYRRLPVGRPSGRRGADGLEIRDTAGWKPALLCLGLRRAALYRRLPVSRLPKPGEDPAGWKPAIQQLGNPRYHTAASHFCEISMRTARQGLNPSAVALLTLLILAPFVFAAPLSTTAVDCYQPIDGGWAIRLSADPSAPRPAAGSRIGVVEGNARAHRRPNA